MAHFLLIPGAGGDAWAPRSWSGIPARAVVGRNDRFFPLAFAQHLVRERLRIEPDIVDSGHLPALAAPEELATLLLGYVAGAGGGRNLG